MASNIDKLAKACVKLSPVHLRLLLRFAEFLLNEQAKKRGLDKG